MAKRQLAKSAASDRLTMHLFAPGMTALHRAGMGGLACTLRYIEHAYADGLLPDDQVPGAPWENGTPPWDIDEQWLTLRFGRPENAAEFMKRLFSVAFQVDRDGLIYLPGQFQIAPSLVVRAAIQQGLTLTFLQFGPHRKLSPNARPVSVDFDGTGASMVTIEIRTCSDYLHQRLWTLFVDGKGCLKTNPIEVIGAFNPGAMIRHNAFKTETRIQETAGTLVPLLFGPVGTISLSVNRGVGVLLVPEVDDLNAFSVIRPLMQPTTSKECQITNAADAALQTQVRLRGKQIIQSHALPGCYAMTLMPTTWSTKQKSRVATMHIPSGEEHRLDRFAIVLANLPPKVVVRTREDVVGHGKQKVVTKRTETIRVDSVVRPLVADNLALGRPWYAGFGKLLTAVDANGHPLRAKLSFERKGLHDMTSTTILWDHDGEAAVVQAVHEALRNRYGVIADANKTNPVAMKKRFNGEYDRWRLAFAGAKTADQFRTALCDLFSRGGNNKVLRTSWRQVLPMIDSTRWQLARDLALLALASYVGKDAVQDPNESDNQVHN